VAGLPGIVQNRFCSFSLGLLSCASAAADATRLVPSGVGDFRRPVKSLRGHEACCLVKFRGRNARLSFMTMAEK
jgi:hypothetical protein